MKLVSRFQNRLKKPSSKKSQTRAVHSRLQESGTRTQWYGLFDCADEELVFGRKPSSVRQRLTARLNSYPVIKRLLGVPLLYWRILWFGRKNPNPPEKLDVPMNIEPWTGKILPHPRDIKNRGLVTKVMDYLSWILAHPDTRYVTYANRVKVQHESLLAWNTHRLHSVLRNRAPGSPRYLASDRSKRG